MQEVKDKVVSHIEAEAEQWLGSAMTYTLFQSVQEHYADLVFAQPDSIADINSHTSKLKIADGNQQVYCRKHSIYHFKKIVIIKAIITFLSLTKQ